MYVKIDAKLKTIIRIEPTSDSETSPVHTETETGKEKVYKSPSESHNYYHLRKLLASDIYVPGDIVCGNNGFLIKMTLTLLNIDNQHEIIVSII